HVSEARNPKNMSVTFVPRSSEQAFVTRPLPAAIGEVVAQDPEAFQHIPPDAAALVAASAAISLEERVSAFGFVRDRLFVSQKVTIEGRVRSHERPLIF